MQTCLEIDNCQELQELLGVDFPEMDCDFALEVLYDIESPDEEVGFQGGVYVRHALWMADSGTVYDLLPFLDEEKLAEAVLEFEDAKREAAEELKAEQKLS